MGELPSLFDLLKNLGFGGAAALVVYALYRRVFVHHAELERALADRDRQTERAEKAEQKLIETIPKLIAAIDQIGRAAAVAEKATETTAVAAKTAVSVVKAVKAGGSKE